MYLVTTPKLLRTYYPSFLIWDIATTNKVVYLTFDDGPHPTITPFVLATLQQFSAKATFFCIGKNVVDHPTIYNQILLQGHAVGNHTFNHFNGWQTSAYHYIKDISLASKSIASGLFRPPYGRISKRQVNELIGNQLLSISSPLPTYKIIMWSVLSGDFDTKLSSQQCLQNVLNNAKEGSIVVFHDSEKAFERMAFALPKVLEHFSKLGYRFEVIPQ